jgi:hypothetical protein
VNCDDEPTKVKEKLAQIMSTPANDCGELFYYEYKGLIFVA